MALVDRSNLTIVARTRSDENGKYVFNGLNTETSDYLVFGVDDDDPLKNAEIHDHIRPISGHQGADYPHNWLWLVKRKNPINLFTGITYNEYFIDGSTNAYQQNGTYTQNQISETAGATTLPMTELNLGRIANNGFVVSEQIKNDPANQFTMEAVIDLSSENISVLCSVDDSFAKFTIITCQNGTIQVGAWTGYQDKYVITHNTSITGVAHVVAVFEFGNAITLYINGEQVAQASFTVTKATNYPGYLRNLSYLSINGNNTWNTPYIGKGRIGAVAVYYDLLSAEEIQEHYQALFTPTLPKLTGYIKEIFLDNPLHLYRLNETEIKDGISDHLTQSKVINATTLTGCLPNQPSLVSGGNTILLNGTYFTGTIPAYRPSPIGFTFEAIIRLDNTPTADQTIYYQEIDKITIKRLKTSGMIEVGFAITGSSVETIQFSALPINQLMHMAITVDKTSKQATIYTNGEATQQVGITAAQLALAGAGNAVLKTLTIGQNFTGLLGEVAIYPTPLSAERIKSHYDAMVIA